MIALLERLLPLWTEPVDGRGDPEAAFGEMYADPVLVNGTEMSLDALVARARSLQQAFDQDQAKRAWEDGLKANKFNPWGKKCQDTLALALQGQEPPRT